MLCEKQVLRVKNDTAFALKTDHKLLQAYRGLQGPPGDNGYAGEPGLAGPHGDDGYGIPGTIISIMFCGKKNLSGHSSCIQRTVVILR